MFTKAFANEGERLNQLVLLIPPRQQEQLSELVDRKEGITKDIDVDAMVNELEKHLKRHFWKGLNSERPL